MKFNEIEFRHSTEEPALDFRWRVSYAGRELEQKFIVREYLRDQCIGGGEVWRAVPDFFPGPGE